jgi:hypothetical protein
MKGRRLLALACAATLALTLATAAGSATSVEHGKFTTLPAGTAMGLEVRGVALLKRDRDGTWAKLVAHGLTPDALYAAHLHDAPCAVNEGGGHYKDDPAGPAEPPNELWLSSTSDPKAGVTANRGGVVHGDGSAPWVARPEAQSIVLHYVPPGGSTSGGPKVACADLG